MEWSELFQPNILEDSNSSVAFIKQLTVASICTITYLKDVIPKNSYREVFLEDIKLHIIKKTCRNGLAQFLSTALAESFDAVDKKYLQKLALCFYEGGRSLTNLVESHVFEYVYKEEGVSMSVSSKKRDNDEHTMKKCTFDNIHGQAMNLIKTYIVMLDVCRTPLNSEFGLSLRLYYNNDAPPDYHAGGFSRAKYADILADKSLERYKLCSVDTPFHRLSVKLYVKTHNEDSHEAIPSQNPPVLSDDLADANKF